MGRRFRAGERDGARRRVGSVAMTEGTNLTTAEGLRELEAELAVLEGDGRREIAERIKTAREWGDLKENSEYHDAKNDQAHLETKIARLREKISDAVVVADTPDVASGIVSFGSTVVVRDEQGVEQTWRIVSSHDAAPREGRLSAESPMAVALLGRAPGEQTAVSLPKGKRTLTVLSVS
jgi:transcription elongation factor GreA